LLEALTWPRSITNFDGLHASTFRILVSIG
jgi:hypothetical protein